MIEFPWPPGRLSSSRWPIAFFLRYRPPWGSWQWPSSFYFRAVATTSSGHYSTHHADAVAFSFLIAANIEFGCIVSKLQCLCRIRHWVRFECFIFHLECLKRSGETCLSLWSSCWHLWAAICMFTQHNLLSTRYFSPTWDVSFRKLDLIEIFYLFFWANSSNQLLHYSLGYSILTLKWHCLKCYFKPKWVYWIYCRFRMGRLPFLLEIYYWISNENFRAVITNPDSLISFKH